VGVGTALAAPKKIKGGAVTLLADGVPFEASVMVMFAEGRHLRYRLIAS
jgi:hypothetical protein